MVTTLQSMANEPLTPTNNSSSALTKLLSQINLPTLAMIVLMGGGNLFATKDDGRLTREEGQRVIAQVNDLHNALDDFEKRQKQILENQADILRRLQDIQKRS
jgi:hypothetical protein